MMNEQNEEKVSDKNNPTKFDEIYSDSAGFVKSSRNEDRGPVKTDEKSIQDDINDYLFLKSYKVKEKVLRTGSNADNNYFVKSNNASYTGKRRKKFKSSKRHKMRTWKKVLLSIGCTILALVLIFVGTIAVLLYKGSHEMFMDDYIITAPDNVSVQNQGEYVVYNGQTYQFNKNITSILCMGIDKRTMEGTTVNGTGGQADVIILMAVDTSTGKISLINISRDTMTDVTSYSAGGTYVGTSTEQICLSYAYGDGKELSCENTVNSVKRLFYNIPIKSYLSLDLDGISAVNDSIGGVDVVSPETIGSFTEGETYHLEGDLAETFVRTRNQETVDANNYRMQRQQTYVTAFMNKVIAQTKQDISTPLDLFNSASPYMCTNLNPSKVCYLAGIALTNNGMSFEMKNVPGDITMGEKYAEYYVNETEFYEMFLSVFYNPV